MATLINLPPPPTTSSAMSSGPSTPQSTTSHMSAISTTAIKDGHEGHRPNANVAYDIAADRVARLGGIRPALAPRGMSANGVEEGGGYFAQQSGASYGSNGTKTPEAPSEDGGMKSPRLAMQQTMQNNQNAAAAVSAAQRLHPHPPAPQTANANLNYQGHGQQSLVPPQASDSPASSASTQTTASVAEAKKKAKMIDGMTYDKDVVDTTDREPRLE